MTMRCTVQGLGWVTTAGHGRRGEGRACVFTHGPLPKPPACASLAGGLRRFGRLDAYTRLGLAAIALALEDADLAKWNQKRFLGLVTATETGCFKTDEKYCHTMLPDGGRFASPNLFAYTLPNCMLGEASIHFGLSGPQFVVEDAGSDMLAGVRAGLDMLRFGLCDTVVAGVCNTFIESDTIAGRCPPGAAFFVLAKDSAGELSLDGDTLRWRDKPVASLASLVNAVGDTGRAS